MATSSSSAWLKGTLSPRSTCLLALDPLDDDFLNDSNNDIAIDVYNFLRTSKFKPVTEGANGSSWLELLVASRTRSTLLTRF